MARIEAQPQPTTEIFASEAFSFTHVLPAHENPHDPTNMIPEKSFLFDFPPGALRLTRENQPGVNNLCTSIGIQPPTSAAELSVVVQTLIIHNNFEYGVLNFLLPQNTQRSEQLLKLTEAPNNPDTCCDILITKKINANNQSELLKEPIKLHLHEGLAAGSTLQEIQEDKKNNVTKPKHFGNKIALELLAGFGYKPAENLSAKLLEKHTAFKEVITPYGVDHKQVLQRFTDIVEKKQKAKELIEKQKDPVVIEPLTQQQKEAVTKFKEKQGAGIKTIKPVMEAALTLVAQEGKLAPEKHIELRKTAKTLLGWSPDNRNLSPEERMINMANDQALLESIQNSQLKAVLTKDQITKSILIPSGVRMTEADQQVLEQKIQQIELPQQGTEIIVKQLLPNTDYEVEINGKKTMFSSSEFKILLAERISNIITGNIQQNPIDFLINHVAEAGIVTIANQRNDQNPWVALQRYELPIEPQERDLQDFEKAVKSTDPHALDEYKKDSPDESHTKDPKLHGVIGIVEKPDGTIELEDDPCPEHAAQVEKAQEQLLLEIAPLQQEVLEEAPEQPELLPELEQPMEQATIIGGNVEKPDNFFDLEKKKEEDQNPDISKKYSPDIFSYNNQQKVPVSKTSERASIVNKKDDSENLFDEEKSKTDKQKFYAVKSIKSPISFNEVNVPLGPAIEGAEPIAFNPHPQESITLIATPYGGKPEASFANKQISEDAKTINYILRELNILTEEKTALASKAPEGNIVAERKIADVVVAVALEQPEQDSYADDTMPARDVLSLPELETPQPIQKQTPSSVTSSLIEKEVSSGGKIVNYAVSTTSQESSQQEFVTVAEENPENIANIEEKKNEPAYQNTSVQDTNAETSETTTNNGASTDRLSRYLQKRKQVKHLSQLRTTKNEKQAIPKEEYVTDVDLPDTEIPVAKPTNEPSEMPEQLNRRQQFKDNVRQSNTEVGVKETPLSSTAPKDLSFETTNADVQIIPIAVNSNPAPKLKKKYTKEPANEPVILPKVTGVTTSQSEELVLNVPIGKPAPKIQVQETNRGGKPASAIPTGEVTNSQEATENFYQQTTVILPTEKKLISQPFVDSVKTIKKTHPIQPAKREKTSSSYQKEIPVTAPDPTKPSTPSSFDTTETTKDTNPKKTLSPSDQAIAQENKALQQMQENRNTIEASFQQVKKQTEEQAFEKEMKQIKQQTQQQVGATEKTKNIEQKKEEKNVSGNKEGKTMTAPTATKQERITTRKNQVTGKTEFVKETTSNQSTHQERKSSTKKTEEKETDAPVQAGTLEKRQQNKQTTIVKANIVAQKSPVSQKFEEVKKQTRSNRQAAELSLETGFPKNPTDGQRKFLELLQKKLREENKNAKAMAREIHQQNFQTVPLAS